MKQAAISAIVACVCAFGVCYAMRPAQAEPSNVSRIGKTLRKIAVIGGLLFGASDAQAGEYAAAGGGGVNYLAVLAILLSLVAVFSTQIKRLAASFYERAKTLKLPTFSRYFQADWLVIIPLFLAIFIAVQMLPMRGCSLPSISIPFTTKADTAVYTYEKDQTAIPNAVKVAIDKLKRAGINASIDEQDSTDGDRQVPDQYKVSRPAAKEAGLPALVVLGGGKVIRVVKAPATEGDVMEAVR